MGVLLNVIPKDKDLSEITSAQKRPLAKLLAHYQKCDKTRDKAICEAFKNGGYGMRENGDFFGLHYSKISWIVKSNNGSHETRPDPKY